jgi:hypothetical protein
VPDQVNKLSFELEVERSSWVTVRVLPSAHTVRARPGQVTHAHRFPQ